MALSNAPTPELRARAALRTPEISPRAFRPYWRRIDPLEKMLQKGLISLPEKRAAERFRATWEAAFSDAVKTQAWQGIRIDQHSRRPDALVMTERQVHALSQVRRVTDALGTRLPLLVAVVVEGLCYAVLARELNINARTVQRRAVAAIAALAAVM